MEQKLKEKSIVYPLFCIISCVAGFFYLRINGLEKEAILLVPVFVFSIYRLYMVKIDVKKQNSKSLLSEAKKNSLLIASCNTVVFFLLCMGIFSDLEELYYVTIVASVFSVFLSWRFFKMWKRRTVWLKIRYEREKWRGHSWCCVMLMWWL